MKTNFILLILITIFFNACGDESYSKAEITNNNSDIESNKSDSPIYQGTAFNKNFGNSYNDVARGNHTHDDRYYKKIEIDKKINNLNNKIGIVVSSIDDLDNIDRDKHQVAIVKEPLRGGLFIYNKNRKSENDGGTIFNGWVRQNLTEIKPEWFGLKYDMSKDEQIEVINYMLNNTKYYKFYLSHNINYGFSRATGEMPNNLLDIPNRDLIIIDDSIDEYSSPDHQGGQTRVYYQSKDATNGNHNGFDYKIAPHHIGSYYMLVGDGIDPQTGKINRYATNWFGINNDAQWGIGMGIASVDANDPDADIKASSFKIDSNHYMNKKGLTNVFEINQFSGYWGFRQTNPAVKYHFLFEDEKNEKIGKSVNDSTLMLDNKGSSSISPILWFNNNDESYTKLLSNYGEGLKIINHNANESTQHTTYVGKDRLTFEGYNAGVHFNSITNTLSLVNSNGSQRLTVDSDGNIIVNIPSKDPQKAGALWNDNGVLKISSGE